MQINLLQHVLLLLLAGLGAFADTDADAESRLTRRSVQLWSWPLSDTSPQKLAQISYQVEPSGIIKAPSNASVISYDSSHISPSSNDYVRVGLWEAETSTWTGIVTSASTFDPTYNRKITLHTDENGEVYNCGLEAYMKPKTKKRSSKSRSKKASTRTATKSPKKSASSKQAKAKAKSSAVVEDIDQPLIVELVPVVQGAQPILNKPVVLDAEGKNPADKPEEKSFLQKYWWAIAGFLVLQLLVGGGASQEEGGGGKK